MVEETFEDSVVICKQDEIGDKLYLIKDGKAICTQVGTDGEKGRCLRFGEICE
jgi:hypothetical protein